MSVGLYVKQHVPVSFHVWMCVYMGLVNGTVFFDISHHATLIQPDEYTQRQRDHRRAQVGTLTPSCQSASTTATRTQTEHRVPRDHTTVIKKNFTIFCHSYFSPHSTAYFLQVNTFALSAEQHTDQVVI